MCFQSEFTIFEYKIVVNLLSWCCSGNNGPSQEPEAGPRSNQNSSITITRIGAVFLFFSLGHTIRESLHPRTIKPNINGCCISLSTSNTDRIILYNLPNHTFFYLVVSVNKPIIIDHSGCNKYFLLLIINIFCIYTLVMINIFFKMINFLHNIK